MKDFFCPDFFLCNYLLGGLGLGLGLYFLIFLIEGSANIRDINKGLKWKLPTSGPRTLNGLILEHLEHIPESQLSVVVSINCRDLVALFSFLTK